MESRIDVNTADRRAEWRITGRLSRAALLDGWNKLIAHPDWAADLDLLVSSTGRHSWPISSSTTSRSSRPISKTRGPRGEAKPKPGRRSFR